MKPAVVQQELARLVQHVSVTDHLPRRKTVNSVTSSRQPMKAFAQTKDDATIDSKLSGMSHTIRVPERRMHRAASSENLRAVKENGSKPVKKSSSEQNLKGRNTLPRTSKRQPRPQSVSSVDKHWPRASTPRTDDRESGASGYDGIVSSSSSSSSSSPDGNPSANTGFAAQTTAVHPPSSGLSTHVSQFTEEAKGSSGVCRVPSPNCERSKGSEDATLSHPLSHVAGLKCDFTLQTIMPLLKELLDQNQKLMQRQGEECLSMVVADDKLVIADVLEQKLLASNQQLHAELKREVSDLQTSITESMCQDLLLASVTLSTKFSCSERVLQ